MAVIILKDRKSKFQVRVKDSRGMYYPQKSFACPKAAERYHRKLYSRRDAGGKSSDARKEKMSLENFWTLWADTGLKTDSGWSSYQVHMWRTYISPKLGTKPMAGIRGHDVDVILKDMDDLGRAAQTRLHVFNLLHKMFADAVRKHGMNFLERNPVNDAYKPVLRDLDVPYLEPDEAKKYITTVFGTYLEVPVAIQLLAFLRVSEVQALKWDEDIDWDKWEIKVFKRYRRKLDKVGACSKLKPGGRVPISPPLREILKRAFDRRESDFIAPGPKGTMLNYNTYYGAVKKVCKGLGLKNIGTQGFRHSASEIYVEGADATEEVIARMLRHTSSKCTRRYMHKSSRVARTVTDRLKCEDWLPAFSADLGVQAGVQSADKEKAPE